MKYIKTFETIRSRTDLPAHNKYVSDEEIESEYNNFKITKVKVEKLFDDGGATGCVEFDEIAVDNWIKYDSGPRIAFEHWYPSEMNDRLKNLIEKEIKEEKLRRDAEKYNL